MGIAHYDGFDYGQEIPQQAQSEDQARADGPETQLLIHLSRQQRRALARQLAMVEIKQWDPSLPRWWRRAFSRSVQGDL